MPFSLDQVVPWGRSFDEYCRMFALTGAILSGRYWGALTVLRRSMPN